MPANSKLPNNTIWRRVRFPYPEHAFSPNSFNQCCGLNQDPEPDPAIQVNLDTDPKMEEKNTFENCNLLIPGPDTDPGTPLNPDPDTQHWFLHKEERSREQNDVKNMIFVITEIK